MERETTTHTSRTRHIARCTTKGCKAASSALVETTVERTTTWSNIGVRTSRRIIAATVVDGTWAIGYDHTPVAPALDCGHGKVRTHAVEGTFSEAHECGAKCLNAVGPSCECSCGGEMHGANHAH